ncbi:hypothetical protein N7494_001518 [Penicillium frequentans]|uniref:RRM domain-containing protein n=1 Tax=Penicillium frequentans TaxID=3151616 RepID=A0AAD6D4C5_9EURO|nr:hypothetical protein N7494_001518 [Penicillium glabrum]
MMLKPFQIKDQQGSPSSNPVGPSAIREVQISASEYDDIASNHPRARLTYLDDDDGDQITVGSSLELAQRLDEPLEIRSRHAPIQASQDEAEPMHIFDIRRSNSVTELWKRFENQASPDPQLSETKNDAPRILLLARNPLWITSAPLLPPGDDSRPLLAAFEAELASLLGSSDEPAERAPQIEPSPAHESSTNSSAQRMPQVAEALAAQILHHLANGANVVQSELRTRLPDLQRQVRDAQRHLPENIGASLQALLTTLEVHVRAAFNNIPDNGRQWADNGRQWAEEAIHAGRPVAENAAEGFRMMASEFNEVGRTLFAAFEHEFGRAAPRGMNDPSDGSNTPSISAANGASNTPFTSTNPQITEPHPADSKTEEKSTMGYDLASMAELASSSHATAFDAGPSDASLPIYPQSSPSSHHYGLPSVSHSSYSLPRTGGYTPTYYPPPYCSTFVPYQFSQPRSGGHHAHSPPKTRHSDLGATFPWAPRINGILPNHRPGPLPVPSVDLPLSTMGTQTGESGNRTLFIGNVGFNVTERTIQDVFASKGFLITVDLPLDAVSGKHAGFGYLHFPSIHPAMAAMDALQGTHIDGHAINLEFSDALPIQGVNNTPNQQNSQLRSGSKIPVSSEVEQKQSVPIKRRKSVTFQVSNQSTKETVASQSQNADKTATPSAEAAVSSPLIDFSTDEPASAPRAQQPSILKEPRQQSNYRDEHDNSFNLNPELEMSRFPPVSQLEAQHLATQRQRQAPGPAPITPIANNHDTVPAFTEDLPHRSHTVTHAHGRGNRGHAGPGLRRASTTTITPLRQGTSKPRVLDEASGTSSLRRRASERQPLRTTARPVSDLDTWARLDRRERERSRPSSQHSIPGSFPVEEVPQLTPFEASANDKQDAWIEDCVSSLIDMGYGSVEDGGRARMAIYAAACNGNLFDAIEMIEEERKAYAHQGRE